MSIEPEALYDLLAARRTIPLFDPDKPVSTEDVLRAIKAARWAPNHHLTEPWRFYLLGESTTRQYLELLESLTEEIKGAVVARQKVAKAKRVPCWLVVTCIRTPNHPLQQTEDYAAVCCAIQNLSLMLWTQGLGCKWSTGPITRDARFYELLQLSAEDEAVVGLLPIGYPAKIPESRRRKPVEEILKVLD